MFSQTQIGPYIVITEGRGWVSPPQYFCTAIVWCSRLIAFFVIVLHLFSERNWKEFVGVLVRNEKNLYNSRAEFLDCTPSSSSSWGAIFKMKYGGHQMVSLAIMRRLFKWVIFLSSPGPDVIFSPPSTVLHFE